VINEGRWTTLDVCACLTDCAYQCVFASWPTGACLHLKVYVAMVEMFEDILSHLSLCVSLATQQDDGHFDYRPRGDVLLGLMYDPRGVVHIHVKQGRGLQMAGREQTDTVNAFAKM